MCNAPSPEVSSNIAQNLVESRLAACVNILGECRSVYRWKGKTEYDCEIPLLIKTTQSRFESLRDAIVRLHPYDVPEVIAVPITDGHSPYLQFIRESCEEQ